MYSFRPVQQADVDLISRHRHEMFKASGRNDEVLDPMTASFRDWLPSQLASGNYFGWIAVDEGGLAVGGLGMMVIDWPPHPSHPTQSARGYILNVFVEEEHRGRGIARELMARAMEEAIRRRLQFMILHTTRMGRPIYEELGWRQTSEMSIAIPVPNGVHR